MLEHSQIRNAFFRDQDAKARRNFLLHLSKKSNSSSRIELLAFAYCALAIIAVVATFVKKVPFKILISSQGSDKMHLQTSVIRQTKFWRKILHPFDDELAKISWWVFVDFQFYLFRIRHLDLFGFKKRYAWFCQVSVKHYYFLPLRRKIFILKYLTFDLWMLVNLRKS